MRSWYARSSDDNYLFIFQTIFTDRDSMKLISELSQKKLDANDGGVQSCLIGPPLVGIFDIVEEIFPGV